jgi:AcrR family transcriptional regulator
VSNPTKRPLRADAQRNRDRLLEAAATAFARQGRDVTLNAIARDAGVGIGTLFRHFPTREALVEATYRNELARLCAAVPELLESSSAEDALRAWMDQFVAYMTTKRGMADTLRAVIVSGGELYVQTWDQLTAAIATLLDAGIAAGTIRSDVDADDVLAILGGVTQIVERLDQPDRTGRLLDLLMDGLRHGTDRR